MSESEMKHNCGNCWWAATPQLEGFWKELLGKYARNRIDCSRVRPRGLLKKKSHHCSAWAPAPQPEDPSHE